MVLLSMGPIMRVYSIFHTDTTLDGFMQWVLQSIQHLWLWRLSHHWHTNCSYDWTKWPVLIKDPVDVDLKPSSRTQHIRKNWQLPLLIFALEPWTGAICWYEESAQWMIHWYQLYCAERCRALHCGPLVNDSKSVYWGSLVGYSLRETAKWLVFNSPNFSKFVHQIGWNFVWNLWSSWVYVVEICG